jgi:hypothetical protein
MGSQQNVHDGGSSVLRETFHEAFILSDFNLHRNAARRHCGSMTTPRPTVQRRGTHLIAYGTFNLAHGNSVDIIE